MSMTTHNADASKKARQSGLSRSVASVQPLPFNTDFLDQHYNTPHTAIAPEADRLEKGENASHVVLFC